MSDNQRGERVATMRRLIAAGRFCQQRINEFDTARETWCVDDWEATAAEIAAELGIGRGRASSSMRYGLTLLERFPKLADVCLSGAVEFRVLAAIEYRTALITDPEVWARLDSELADLAPRCNGLSQEKLIARIDWLVIELDPEAIRVARRSDADRHVGISPDQHGMAELWGRLRAPDGAALDARLDELAATVCRHDPRTVAQRRADAVAALVEGATTLACTCATQDCPVATAAGTTATGSQVVIHVIAEAATVTGTSDKPGYLQGYGTIPAATVAELAATRAKLRNLRSPSDFKPEPGYRPSTALAEFVRYRDLTCRWPGCDVPAERCDLDHTIPWPYGPTHPSNIKPYCGIHHLLKTFYTGVGGWQEIQYPDGTITWTSPSGRTYTTKPGGSLFFPQLATPTGTLSVLQHPPSNPAKTLMMPTRDRTRAADRAARIEWERGINRARYAAHPPPF